MRQMPLGVRLPDRATFATFLVARNAQAVDHLQRVAHGTVSGTTWICGPTGSGRTHLLQATCAGSGPGAGYFPLSELLPLGAASLEGLPGLGCVCIDDVDRVAGSPEWERALFAMLREIEERGGRLVVAAEPPPALLRWALPDLGSRLAASHVFQLRALDEAEQVEALQLRAAVRGCDLPDETARWLQRRFPRDMRTLYGLLDTLDEASLTAQRRLTIPFIRSVLRETG
jgi:DnaA family protein